jgi:hypothetical protein
MVCRSRCHERIDWHGALDTPGERDTFDHVWHVLTGSTSSSTGHYLYESLNLSKWIRYLTDIKFILWQSLLSARSLGTAHKALNYKKCILRKISWNIRRRSVSAQCVRDKCTKGWISWSKSMTMHTFSVLKHQDISSGLSRVANAHFYWLVISPQ